eukprot:comp23070_c0_seq1/m.36985 comp23070_c0_seq1/g.36985  ORF comp23070_c0_seq1/g.36985 comp23070_c0_seq1/m.36985 type:complete len:128 (-) comp23070_c0_seq1:451-834(-)
MGCLRKEGRGRGLCAVGLLLLLLVVAVCARSTGVPAADDSNPAAIAAYHNLNRRQTFSSTRCLLVCPRTHRGWGVQATVCVYIEQTGTTPSGCYYDCQSIVCATTPNPWPPTGPSWPPGIPGFPSFP